MKKIRSFIAAWYKAARRGRVTTLISLPILVDATIKIMYSFDSDPDTVTSWQEALTQLAIGFGFTAAQDAEADDLSPSTRKRKKP